VGDVQVAATLLPHVQKPFVFLTNLAASADDVQLTQLRDMGIPVLMGTENGVRAIKHLVEYSEFQKRKTANALKPAFLKKTESKESTVPALQQTLDEFSSKQLLSRYGIAIPQEQIANSLSDALRAASEIGYPVALKTASGELHKSDKGGVKLNLQNTDKLTTAYKSLAESFGPRALVQEMIPSGVELILGIVNDVQFGPMLAIGLGGILVEILKDSRLLMLPTTRQDICHVLMNLRGAKILQGARGQAPANLDAIVDAAMALSAFAYEYGDEIAAVEINPLIALPDRAVAVDALIIKK
jgi:acetate---CoA ligase (ADP-forming)